MMSQLHAHIDNSSLLDLISASLSFFSSVIAACVIYFRDFRNNKGCILKASVDYIRELRREQQRMKLIEDKLQQTERQNKLLMLRLQVQNNESQSQLQI